MNKALSEPRRFAGWQQVADLLHAKSMQEHNTGWSLNHGQRATLRALAARLPSNGVLIADEVGMGKTRIAVALTRCVIEAGGRVSILVPPGLVFQWQTELRDGGLPHVEFLRSLQTFTNNRSKSGSIAPSPWFERDVVLASHRLTQHWQIGESSNSWRWALLPALYSYARRKKDFRKNLEACRDERDEHWKQELFDHAMDRAKEIARYLRSPSVADELSARAGDILTGLKPEKLLKPELYGNSGELRRPMQRAMGLGLGSFDLIITDEAHKSRAEGSGLSTLLEEVIVPSLHARRVSMTATPVELNHEQWHQALLRIGVSAETMSTMGDQNIFEAYITASRRLREVPGNVEAQQSYASAARQFQACLSPYVLRRDKREMQEIQDFSHLSGQPADAYRAFKDVAINPVELSPNWKHAVCAAEALSIACRQADDSIAKRLRLTMGNGHGIAALLDLILADTKSDKAQLEADGDIAAAPDAADSKRLARVDWWKRAMAAAIPDRETVLFNHPAIIATVHAIEQITGEGDKSTGRKVLVFGRFTRPMQALMQMLNARAMLKALGQEKPWPQAKIHDEDWPAIEVAHRALRGMPADRTALDAELQKQYNADEYGRSKRREALSAALNNCLAGSRWEPVLHAFERAEKDYSGAPGLSPRILLHRALEAAELGPSPSNDTLRRTFVNLIETILHRDDDDSDEAETIDDKTAQDWWAAVQKDLKEEFGQSRGAFARLMNGATSQQSRRLMQLAFNRSTSFPKVLIAQSVVGREGLNLHEACRDVVLLHPEWNPGVVEQQIGRVDRVGSQWTKDICEAKSQGRLLAAPDEVPRISIQSVVFQGTYDEGNWMTLQSRWDELRATLHGVVIPSELAQRAQLPAELVEKLNGLAPNFSPDGCEYRNKHLQAPGHEQERRPVSTAA